MSVMLTVARKELLELRSNKRVLASIVLFAMVFAWVNSSVFSELQWIFLSTLIGMYAAFSLSGQAFNQEKMSGTLETQFCGPLEVRDLWTGKILGTLIPAVLIAYAAASVSVLLVITQGSEVGVSLPSIIYVVAVLPALVASFIGLMGFIQLNFEARMTRMLSMAVMVLIIFMLTSMISLQMSGSMSWTSIVLIAVVVAGLLTLPALLVNRLSKERIILTSEG